MDNIRKTSSLSDRQIGYILNTSQALAPNMKKCVRIVRLRANFRNCQRNKEKPAVQLHTQRNRKLTSQPSADVQMYVM
jgi:hypothetical protein